jgi:hypothetical protein
MRGWNAVHAAQGGDAQSTLEYPHERRRNRSRSTSYDNIGQAVSIAEVDEDTEEGFNDSATTNVLASVGEAEKEMDVDVKVRVISHIAPLCVAAERVDALNVSTPTAHILPTLPLALSLLVSADSF